MYLTSINNFLYWATICFKNLEIESPRLTAELLLSKVLKVRDRITLYLCFKNELTFFQFWFFKKMVLSCLKYEPVAYILGEKEFHGLIFKVGPGVLIPRSETEHLVEAGLGIIKNIEDPLILDICTGSGCVGLSLLREHKKASLIGVDIEQNALEYARLNSRELGVESRVKWKRSDIFSKIPVKKKFHLIVANPPYVKNKEWYFLPVGIQGYEPREAFVSGINGLNIIDKIIFEAYKYLRDAGYLLIELGKNQVQVVIKMAEESKQFTKIESIKDLSNIDRVLICKK